MCQMCLSAFAPTRTLGTNQARHIDQGLPQKEASNIFHQTPRQTVLKGDVALGDHLQKKPRVQSKEVHVRPSLDDLAKCICFQRIHRAQVISKRFCGFLRLCVCLSLTSGGAILLLAVRLPPSSPHEIALAFYLHALGLMPFPAWG